MSSTSSTPPTPPTAASITTAQIESAILDALNETATIAGTVDPSLQPYIILGKAAESALPGLIADIQGLMAQAQPAAADVTALGGKIIALSKPQLL